MKGTLDELRRRTSGAIERERSWLLAVKLIEDGAYEHNEATGHELDSSEDKRHGPDSSKSKLYRCGCKCVMM